MPSMQQHVPSPTLRGRKAIVTGGGRGLGRVMALALTGAGVDVAITGARSIAELDDTVAAANCAGGGRCVAMAADVADAAACAQVVRRVEELFGGIDILVNNAARGPTEQASSTTNQGAPPFWDADPDAWLRMMTTNIGGPFLMARFCAPLMIRAGHGRIINISTSRPTMVLPRAGPYGATKAALEACTRIWAGELAGTGVTVNVLLPGGPSDTALIPGPVGGRSNGHRAGKEPRGIEGPVEGGLLPPGIMAPPLLWLASDEAGTINGRRFVARDWDPDLPLAQAAALAEAASIDWPHIL